MKGGLGSGKAGAGGMMSFVKKGGKNDRQVGVGGGNKLEEDLSLFRELKNRSNQHKHRNLLLLHPLSLSDEFDDDSLVPNGNNNNNNNNYHRHHHQMLRSIPSAAKKGSSSAGSSDFFLAENDKHDYDWLKTPPATPLFPSIEMEATNNTNKINYNNNNKNGQHLLQQEPPLPQPLSRFAGGNNSEVSSKRNISNMNRNSITEKGGHNQKPKGRTAKNDVVEKTSPSTTSSSRSRSSSTSCKERPPYHAKIILGFSNETPPNLRTEQRSSSTTRGRGAIAVPPPPRVEEATVKTRQKSCSPSVTRGRKVEPIAAMNNNNNNNNNKHKQQETNRNSKGTVVLGSRMVEKVINARKSNNYINNNINYNNNNTITSSGTSSNIRLKDTKPANYYSRAAITQKSPNFGLPRSTLNNNNNNNNKTLISREKARSN